MGKGKDDRTNLGDNYSHDDRAFSRIMLAYLALSGPERDSIGTIKMALLMPEIPDLCILSQEHP